MTDIISQVKPQIGYPDKLEFNPGPRKVRVLNNGHTIKIEYLEEYKLKYGLEEYTLKQLHFHHLSETTEEGEHYPLEGHFVHMSACKGCFLLWVYFLKMKKALKNL